MKIFVFEYQADKKSVSPVSLSGRDARAIYADTSSLKEDYLRLNKSDVCDIFEGVYFHDVYVPAANDNVHVKVLKDLHPNLANSAGNI